MLKLISNLGKELDKSQQKEIVGGFGDVFFESCSGITLQHECIASPTCAWNGQECYTKTPHIV